VQPDHEPTQLADAPDGSGIDFDASLITLGELKQKIGNYAEAEELFRSALRKVELEGAPDDPSIVPALSGLIANHVLGGSGDETEQLVERLSTIAQSVGDDPDIVLVLNDLVRLCLNESAYEVAEPLLLCLLELKKSKGEERPEVATVLASLAVVRQALGQHESAEELWRRVVEIRERTLAPNHFAITSALEHLAASCAARGNVSEAIQLFQRAHTIRAVTLGVDHRSLRFSRERIADLQLQARELADLDTRADAAAAGKALRVGARKRRDRVSIAPMREDDAPAAVATAQPIERDVSPAPTREDAAGLAAATVMTGDLPVSPKATVPFGDRVESVLKELDNVYERLSTRATSILAWARQELPRRYIAVLGAIGVLLTFVLVAQGATSRASNKNAGLFADVRAGRSEARLAVSSPSRAVAPLAFTATTTDASVNSAIPAAKTGTSLGDADKVTTEKSPSRDEPSAAKNESKKTKESDAVAIPAPCGSRERRGCVPKDLRTRVDAIAEAAAAGVSGSAVVDAQLAEPKFTSERTQRQSIDYSESGPPPAGPVLIGGVPTASYPLQLTDVEGEVRVRFNVDTNGRPMMSSFKVVSSSHPLFTAAVRRVVPRMRFEPARSGGAESKPVVDAVEIPFRFKRPAQ
jgi:TonB family protein